MVSEFSRRAFLQSAAVGMCALLVAACTPAA
ncbi:MAG: twin-arginine translocation signal domain-containing protein [Caldilinea sp. CFX5]|nr:twin-arginine translocation signal domain-containing protein [Caldilinea sp. CFX5]